MPNTVQISDILFKKWLGLGTTQSGRAFYNEPITGRPFIVPTQIWSQADQIPATAPGTSTGVVQVVTNCTLTRVVGTVNAYSGVLLRDTIPHNWGDGTSYNYFANLKDDAGNQIVPGSGDWMVDTEAGVLMFNVTGTSNLPIAPSFSQFWRYSGTKGYSTGQFVDTSETGTFAPSGMTGQFITTAQTGHIHSQYLTSVTPVGVTSIFVSGQSISGNVFFTGVSGVTVTVSGISILFSTHGITSTTGQFVTTAQTGHVHSQYALAAMTGEFLVHQDTGSLASSGMTGQFVTTAQTGHLHSQYLTTVTPVGVTSLFVTGRSISGNVPITGVSGISVTVSGANTLFLSAYSITSATGQFVTAAQTGHVHSQYALASQTGQFVTTAQTGHIHSQYALSTNTGQFIDTSETGIFVVRGETGVSFYPRYGNPEGYLTNATLPNAGGVDYLIVTGSLVSGNITFSGAGNVSLLTGASGTNQIIFSGVTGNLVFQGHTGQFAPSGLTGQFVTTAQTGQFAPSGLTGQFITTARTGHIHSQYALVAGTGEFVDTAQSGLLTNAFVLKSATGQFIDSSKTGGFVSISQTGQFVTTALTGQFAPSGMTGQFITTAQTGHVHSQYALSTNTGQFISTAQTGQLLTTNYSGTTRFGGNMTVDGQLSIVNTLGLVAQYINEFNNANTINLTSAKLGNSDPSTSLDWANRLLQDQSSITTLAWHSKQLSGSWSAQALVISGSSPVLCSQTGQFVTTAQTGHIHSQYALVAGTGQFISTAQTGQFAPAGMTGQFVTTAQTGHIHSQYALSTSTGQFISTAQTGQFAPSGMTGQFVTTAQTGGFVSISQTGQFVTTAQTGQYLSAIYKEITGLATGISSGGLLTIPNGRTYITGVNSLSVYVNGEMQYNAFEYIESSVSTIQLTYNVPSDAWVMFEIFK